MAYAKFTKPNFPKLADRTARALMLGYEASSKAYRLYDPVTKKVIMPIDVVFHEGKVGIG